MRQFSLPLQEDTNRPVARIDTFYGYTAMLDTGAVYPVWVRSEEILKGLGAELVKERVTFGGFGGTSSGNLYRLETVEIGELVFPGLPVIAYRIDLPCYMIMSATMFRNLIYEVDDFNHSLNVTIPDPEQTIRNLKVWDSDGRLHVAIQSMKR